MNALTLVRDCFRLLFIELYFPTQKWLTCWCSMMYWTNPYKCRSFSAATNVNHLIYNILRIALTSRQVLILCKVNHNSPTIKVLSHF